ncbi:hypothetical protein ES705_40696 [subsurface metagenome]
MEINDKKGSIKFEPNSLKKEFFLKIILKTEIARIKKITSNNNNPLLEPDKIMLRENIINKIFKKTF